MDLDRSTRLAPPPEAMPDPAVLERPGLVLDSARARDLEGRGQAASEDHAQDRAGRRLREKRRVRSVHPRRDAEAASSIQRPRKAR